MRFSHYFLPLSYLYFSLWDAYAAAGDKSKKDYNYIPSISKKSSLEDFKVILISNCFWEEISGLKILVSLTHLIMFEMGF